MAQMRGGTECVDAEDDHANGAMIASELSAQPSDAISGASNADEVDRKRQLAREHNKRKKKRRQVRAWDELHTILSGISRSTFKSDPIRTVFIPRRTR